MNPTTAVAVVLAALSLALQVESAPPAARRAGRWCAVPVALAGALVLVGYLTGRDAGLDVLLFRDRLAGNRMSPNTALALLLVGSALAVLDRPGRSPHPPDQFLALAALAVCGVGLVRYTFGAEPVHGAGGYVPMALGTAVVLAALAAGTVLARPDRGVAALLRSRGPGGGLARLLSLAAVAIPWGLGWLRLRGEKAGFYDTELGVALMVVVTIALLLGLVWTTAGSLDRADADRRQADAGLRKAADEVRDLYENAPCGYHSVDADGIVVAINRTELRWLGYEKREVVGRMRFADVLAPACREAYRKAFARLKEEGEVHDVELDLVRRDGTTFPVLINSTALRGPDGQYLMSRSTLTDLTERKRVEGLVRRLNEELEARVRERTAELAEANRDLAQKNGENEMFVYSVSHDLRSPLVNLQGFSKELQKAGQGLAALLDEPGVPAAVRDRGRALLDGKMAQALGFIQTAVLRLSNIIDALLRLSRAGRVEYRWETVDVGRVVGQVVGALQGTIAEKQADVRVGELPPAWGDRTAVEQVFANLVGNALTYLDPARPGVVEVGCLPAGSPGVPDGSRAYYVRDNGLGIAEAHRAKIFRAFQRAHPGVGKGEGLGLAIVARVVERHRGRVWVESSPGEGSTFFVTLPAAPAGGDGPATR